MPPHLWLGGGLAKVRRRGRVKQEGGGVKEEERDKRVKRVGVE
jgi:hypothetical protein